MSRPASQVAATQVAGVGRSVCRRMSRRLTFIEQNDGFTCRQISLSADEPTDSPRNRILHSVCRQISLSADEPTPLRNSHVALAEGVGRSVCRRMSRLLAACQELLEFACRQISLSADEPTKDFEMREPAWKGVGRSVCRRMSRPSGCSSNTQPGTCVGRSVCRRMSRPFKDRKGAEWLVVSADQFVGG